MGKSEENEGVGLAKGKHASWPEEPVKARALRGHMPVQFEEEH